jgi:hypothetical protein
MRSTACCHMRIRILNASDAYLVMCWQVWQQDGNR